MFNQLFVSFLYFHICLGEKFSPTKSGYDLKNSSTSNARIMIFVSSFRQRKLVTAEFNSYATSSRPHKIGTERPLTSVDDIIDASEFSYPTRRMIVLGRFSFDEENTVDELLPPAQCFVTRSVDDDPSVSEARVERFFRRCRNCSFKLEVHRSQILPG